MVRTKIVSSLTTFNTARAPQHIWIDTSTDERWRPDCLHHVSNILDAPVSTRIITSQLIASGLHPCSSLKKNVVVSKGLTTPYAMVANWSNTDFEMSQDEPRFCLSNDNSHIRVWYRPNNMSNQAVSLKRPTT
ncbi:hypothetical protein TNCV_3195591 [Trichonephila clavipes]|nr:hypothetical protein TNCV_3195591 [Trichonephila clavipes]